MDDTLKYHIGKGEREVYNEHVVDPVKHINEYERNNWNAHAQSLDNHVVDTSKHITSEERNHWNTHNHDDRYYTESEMQTLLASKASGTHNHTIGDITDISTLTSRIVVTEPIGGGGAISVGGFPVVQPGAVVATVPGVKGLYPGLGNVQGKSVTEILDTLVKMSHHHYSTYYIATTWGKEPVTQCWDCYCNCYCSDDQFS